MPASDSTRFPHGAACPLQVNKVYNEYAMSVQQKLHAAGFHADVDLSQNTLPKMIRNAQQAQYNFILVVGEKERVQVSPRKLFCLVTRHKCCRPID